MVKKVLEKILNTNEEVKYQFSLGERYLKITKIVTIAIGSLVLLIMGLFVLPIFDISGIFILIIIAILLVLLVLFSLFYFNWYLKRANIYIITNRRMLVHRGWLSTRLISADFNKISDVKVAQPFIDRVIYKAGVLKINTAGMEAHPIVLSHIERPYKIKRKLNEIRDSLAKKRSGQFVEQSPEQSLEGNPQENIGVPEQNQ